MLTKDLSITFCGVRFPNPFCLSSSPVGSCYEMCAKAYDTGWGEIVFKTIGFFIANEVSLRFDHLTKEDTGFIGFKNMGQIAEHPLEENLAAIRRLKRNYPDKVLIASIMGENEQQWQELARSYIVYPHINLDKCVGCLLCGHVCPVACIELGEVKFKSGEKEHALTL